MAGLPTLDVQRPGASPVVSCTAWAARFHDLPLAPVTLHAAAMVANVQAEGCTQRAPVNFLVEGKGIFGRKETSTVKGMFLWKQLESKISGKVMICLVGK